MPIPGLYVSVRVYGSLNDFLPVSRRQSTLVCALDDRPSIKDVVEALGVPHPEIDLLIVDGRSVDFSYHVADGDRIAVYPRMQTVDPGAANRLQPSPQPDPRFIADVHLGRLAAYLRLAGFDITYRNDFRDDELVALSASEDRVLLTRDVGVLKHNAVRRGYFVRETQPARQLIELLQQFDLVTRARPFTRCLRCNALLHAVAKNLVEPFLPPRTRECYAEFWQCPGCQHIYWEGSHHTRMRQFLDRAFEVSLIRFR